MSNDAVVAVRLLRALRVDGRMLVRGAVVHVTPEQAGQLLHSGDGVLVDMAAMPAVRHAFAVFQQRAQALS